MLNAVIMAAGKGKRFQKGFYPKSLMPLDSLNQTTLSLNLSHLTSLPLDQIFLVIGANFNTMVQWFHAVPKERKDVKLVDARQSYQKGPLFSFRVLKTSISELEPILLFPADTWFSSHIWKELERILPEISKLDQDILFYSQLPLAHKYGNYAVKINEKNGFSAEIDIKLSITFQKVQEIVPRKVYRRENPNTQKIPLILPFMILSTKTIKSLFDMPSPSVSTIFQAILQMIEEGREIKTISLSLPSQKNQALEVPFFVDLDYYSDYELLKSLVASSNHFNL